MIYVHGKEATMDEINAADLKRPEKAKKYWQGIRHADLIEAVEDEIRSNGWTNTESRFSMSKDGTCLAGAWGIKMPNLHAPDGMEFALGVLTSNDMSRKLKLVSGGTVRVCMNGMATGEIVLAKKHTVRFNLHAALGAAFETYVVASRKMVEVVATLKGIPITPELSEHLLLEAGRKELMPWSRVGDVDAAYRQVPVECQEQWGKGTAWTLLNAFTYVVKRNPPLEQMTQMNGFRNLIFQNTHALAS